LSIRGELHRIAAVTLGSGWRACLRRIESNAPGEIEQEGLRKLLEHALAHVPYYRGLEVAKAELGAFPLLSRETLRTRFEQLKSDDIATRRCRRASTGGSTGEPVWVVQDRGFLDWDFATEMFYLEAFHGMSYDEYLRSRRVAIWHRSRLRAGVSWLKRLGAGLLGQVIYVEPYSILSEERMTDYLHRINRHRPVVILAFAGMAFELARHAQRLGVKMHRPRLILCSAEVLYEGMRNTIEEVFGAPVYNRYGAAEVGRIASECKAGKLHVFSFSNHVEILDEQDRPVSPGAVGRVVVTPLHNLAMPLIRYDIGDLARVASEPCSCGSPLAALEEIRGRVNHYFVRSDGSLVHTGNFVSMLCERDWILRFQVVQEDLDRIRIAFRRTPGREIPEGDLDALSRTIRSIMGEGSRIFWDEVEDVPKSPIGRHLHVRSLVWEERAGVPRERDTSGGSG